MIHLFSLMWSFALVMGFGQVGAGWESYAIVGITAIMFYLMGSEDGAE